MMVQEQKEVNEKVSKAKKFVYPIWALLIFGNTLLMIGYYYQDKLI